MKFSSLPGYFGMKEGCVSKHSRSVSFDSKIILHCTAYTNLGYDFIALCIIRIVHGLGLWTNDKGFVPGLVSQAEPGSNYHLCRLSFETSITVLRNINPPTSGHLIGSQIKHRTSSA